MTRHSEASTSSSSSSSSPPTSPLESYFVALSMSVVARQKRTDDDEISRSPKLTIISDRAKIPTRRLCQQVSFQQQQQQNVPLPYKRSTLTRLPSPNSITAEIFYGGNANGSSGILQSPRSARWSATTPSPRTPQRLLRRERSAGDDRADRSMLLERLRMEGPVLALPPSPTTSTSVTIAAIAANDETKEPKTGDSFKINHSMSPPITPSPTQKQLSTTSSTSTIKQPPPKKVIRWSSDSSIQSSQWDANMTPMCRPTSKQRSTASKELSTRRGRKSKTKLTPQSSLQDLSIKMTMMSLNSSFNDSPRSAAARWNAIGSFDSSSPVLLPLQKQSLSTTATTIMTDNDSPLSCPMRSSTTVTTTTTTSFQKTK